MVPRRRRPRRQNGKKRRASCRYGGRVSPRCPAAQCWWIPSRLLYPPAQCFWFEWSPRHPFLQCCLALQEGVTWALLAIRALGEGVMWARGSPSQLRSRGKWARAPDQCTKSLMMGRFQSACGASCLLGGAIGGRICAFCRGASVWRGYSTGGGVTFIPI